MTTGYYNVTAATGIVMMYEFADQLTPAVISRAEDDFH